MSDHMIQVIVTDIGIENAHSATNLILCLWREFCSLLFVGIWHELTHIELIEPSNEYITETIEPSLFAAYEMCDESSVISYGSFFGLLLGH